MVAVEHQHHRLAALLKIGGQASQHGVGVPDALRIDLQHGAGLVGDVRRGGNGRKGVALAVLVGGVAHVVLDGGGVIEEGASLRHGGFKFLLDLARHVVVRDPAALVFRVFHVSGKDLIFRPQPAVDIFPVVEPGVAGVIERSAVAVGAEHPEQAVQIPIHHPHGGGGGGGEGIGLHTRQHVKLRVGSAAGKAGNHDMSGNGVRIVLQRVEVGQGISLLCPVEHGLIRDVGERLVHHHDDADVLPQSRLLPGFPPGSF